MSVRPRLLTLGVYVDALIAAGVDDGQPWDALAAPADVALAVLDALCDEVRLPEVTAEAIREQAGVAWARLETERVRASAAGARMQAAVEEAVGEGLLPQRTPGAYALLRTLSELAPSERAAALAEPLARALVLARAGAVVRQAKDAEEKALNTARRN